MIKAFIFDMDGVIIDSEPMHLEVVKMVMKELGKEVAADQLDCYIGVTNYSMWTDLKEKHDLKEMVEELKERQARYKDFVFGNNKLQAIEGIFELLEDLKSKGLSIALASSSPRDFIEMILKNLNILSYFDVIVSGEEVKNSKPAPDIFLKAASILGVHPGDCIVLEDSEHGVKAAKTAGMKCIGFKNPHSGKQDISPADLIVASIKNLNYMAV